MSKKTMTVTFASRFAARVADGLNASRSCVSVSTTTALLVSCQILIPPFLLSFTVAAPAFARTTSAKMIPVEAVEAVSSFASNAQLLASSSDDFGGSFLPVAGIGLLATFILYLSPPLAGEE
jgi:hypothetical protein